jgi:rod shape-determining protein MreC
VAVYRRSTRTRYVLAVLVLAALTLVTIDARSSGTGVTNDVRAKVREAFAPLQHATHSALQPIGNFLSGTINYGSLRRENQRLRGQVAALQQQSLQATAEQSAAQQLFATENLPFVGTIPTVSVAVIDNGFSNFENTVTINKGTSSGIAVGQPVVTSGGLVGSVAAVSPRTATVVVLTDPTFAVGVRLGALNVGTAQGMGRNSPLHVTVDTTSQKPPTVTRGQKIVTSGLDLEKFPPYIPVGQVATVTRPPGAAEPTITLTPFVNVDQLSFLQVLIWAPGSTP